MSSDNDSGNHQRKNYLRLCSDPYNGEDTEKTNRGSENILFEEILIKESCNFSLICLANELCNRLTDFVR